MRCSIASICTLWFIVAPLWAAESGKLEAVDMFERLIRRIPPGIDAHKVHEHVGKLFTWVFNGGNADNVAVQWTPFWILDRLYCVQCVQSEVPTVEVYQVIEPDLKSEPFVETAKTAYN